MSVKNLNVNEEDKLKIIENYKGKGLTEDQINKMLDSNFLTFDSKEELDQEMPQTGKYQNVIQALADGYTMDEIEEMGMQNVEDFKSMLDRVNMTPENARAVNQYSNGSNMILGMKRATDKEQKKVEIKEQIINDMESKLKERGASPEIIDKIKSEIENYDYDKPLHENYTISKQSMNENDIPKVCRASINMAVKKLDSLQHIDETIAQLDNALSKAKLEKHIRGYRAVQDRPGLSMDDMRENVGYTSTSPIYDSSFAKYDDFKNVMELYVPAGSRGIDITPFSDYDTTEQEVLMDANDIYFTNVQRDVIDKNGQTKNMFEGILVSKDKECYKENTKQQFKEQDNKTINTSINSSKKEFTNEMANLPQKQSRFNRFWDKFRARFKKNQFKNQEKMSNTKTNQVEQSSKNIAQSQKYQRDNAKSYERKSNPFLESLKVDVSTLGKKNVERESERQTIKEQHVENNLNNKDPMVQNPMNQNTVSQNTMNQNNQPVQQPIEQDGMEL